MRIHYSSVNVTLNCLPSVHAYNGSGSATVREIGGTTDERREDISGGEVTAGGGEVAGVDIAGGEVT